MRWIIGPAVLAGLVLSITLAPDPALAQLVCGGSATGSAPVSGSGSSSANQHDVACGISSVAQGTFRGENAFAASGVARLNDNLYAQAGFGWGMKGAPVVESV